MMSFNIRGSFRDRSKANAWGNRAELNVGTIERYVLDLIGFQELHPEREPRSTWLYSSRGGC